MKDADFTKIAKALADPTRLKMLRDNAEMDQRQFAHAVSRRGVSVTNSFVSKMESGDSKPSIDVLVAMADELDVSADYLLINRTHIDSVAAERLNQTFTKEPYGLIYERGEILLFQRGIDRPAETAFREIARLTKGAYCRFDTGSASQLKDLLTAVAVYASGGRKALAELSDQRRNKQAQLLLQQLR